MIFLFVEEEYDGFSRPINILEGFGKHKAHCLKGGVGEASLRIITCGGTTQNTLQLGDRGRQPIRMDAQPSSIYSSRE